MLKLLLITLSLLSLTACQGASGQAANTEIGPYVQEELSDESLLKSMAIYDGVDIGGLDMAGANKLVAEQRLMDEFEPILDKEISIYYDGGTYSLTYRDLGYSFNYEEAINQAYSYGRQGSPETRLEDIASFIENPVSVSLSHDFNEDIAEESLRKLRDETMTPAQGGHLAYDGDSDTVYVADVSPGLEMDLNDAMEKAPKLEIKPEESVDVAKKHALVNPDLEAVAQSIDGPMGASESFFQTWFWERTENIRISTGELNGVIIMPGETFSFNDYIGDTPYERGYQDAVIIQGTTEVPGKGGGVCQTSTGLYHAALKAGMEIIERHPHTLIMPYSEGGLDAAVDYGIIDLKVRNPYDFPLLIKTNYYEDDNHNGKISFEIWGDTSKMNDEIIIYSHWNYNVSYDTVYGSEYVSGVVGSHWSAYRENTSTGDVEYLGDTYYPAVTEVLVIED